MPVAVRSAPAIVQAPARRWGWPGGRSLGRQRSSCFGCSCARKSLARKVRPLVFLGGRGGAVQASTSITFRLSGFVWSERDSAVTRSMSLRGALDQLGQFGFRAVWIARVAGKDDAGSSPALIQSELSKELPGFLGNPVGVAPGIAVDVRVRAVECADLGGIFRLARRHVVADVRA
jgi:hypothetical protein